MGKKLVEKLKEVPNLGNKVMGGAILAGALLSGAGMATWAYVKHEDMTRVVPSPYVYVNKDPRNIVILGLKEPEKLRGNPISIDNVIITEIYGAPPSENEGRFQNLKKHNDPEEMKFPESHINIEGFCYDKDDERIGRISGTLHFYGPDRLTGESKFNNAFMDLKDYIHRREKVRLDGISGMLLFPEKLEEGVGIHMQLHRVNGVQYIDRPLSDQTFTRMRSSAGIY